MNYRLIERYDLLGTRQGAIYSEDSRYRFALWRIWKAGPTALIIGLNPSTATETIDDPTIRRCISFMDREGFGGFYMLNLFAFRATNPFVMKMEADPIGEGNDEHLRAFAAKTDKVIFAWGAIGIHRNRDKEVVAMFPNAHCFGTTKSGQPKHPLYLESSTEIIPYRYEPHT